MAVYVYPHLVTIVTLLSLGTLDKYSIYTVYNFTSVTPLKLIHSSYELFLRNENCRRGGELSQGVLCSPGYSLEIPNEHAGQPAAFSS